MYSSEITIPEGCVVVFDLDDTLYHEVDYVFSGFASISSVVRESFLAHLKTHFENGIRDPLGATLDNPEEWLPEKSDLIDKLRSHLPDICLRHEVTELLRSLRQHSHPIGVLTDGRSQTQRNKIRALGLDVLVDATVVSEEIGSEKPSEQNYRYFENQFPGKKYAYVGDNLNKDFVTPNRLGWMTVCVVNSGRNVHEQAFESCAAAYLPKYAIPRLSCDTLRHGGGVQSVEQFSDPAEGNKNSKLEVETVVCKRPESGNEIR